MSRDFYQGCDSVGACSTNGDFGADAGVYARVECTLGTVCVDASCQVPPNWCASGPCCDLTTYRIAPAGAFCGSGIETRRRCDGDQLIEQSRFFMCDGTSPSVCAAPGAQTGWDDWHLGDCEDEAMRCAHELLDGGAAYLPPGRTNYCTLREGRCPSSIRNRCCSADGFVLPAGTVCATTEASAPACSGNAVVTDVAYAVCDGVRGICGGPVGPTEWFPGGSNVTPCGTGNTCQDGECVPTSEICTSGSCCIGGRVAPPGYQCVPSAVQMQETRCNGSTIERRDILAGCTGQGATSCSVAAQFLVASPFWQAVSTCPSGTRCVTSGNTTGCVAPSSLPCSGTTCCVNGVVASPGTLCGAPVRTEERCTGATIEARSASPTCNGFDTSCTAEGSRAQWGNWHPVVTCPSAEACVPTGVDQVGCTQRCTAGVCCLTSVGRVAPRGTTCGSYARTEYTCGGNVVLRREATYGCPGTAATCSTAPEDYVWGPWSVSAQCASGTTCVMGSGTPSCVGTGGTAAGACGASCTTSATCASGACVDGHCLPSACSGCHGLGQDCTYNTSTCAFAGCASGSTNTCGEMAGGTLTRSSLTIGTAQVSTMNVRYRFDTLLGEALVFSEYQFFSSPSGATLPYTTGYHIQVTGGGGEGTWYIYESPVVPDEGGEWSYNVTGSPRWDRLFCGGPAAPTTCLSTEEAKALWRDGFCVTGFVVVW